MSQTSAESQKVVMAIGREIVSKLDAVLAELESVKRMAVQITTDLKAHGIKVKLW